MKTKEKVLTLLVSKKGEYISGSELAKELGLSRNSVWKAINSLKEDGYSISSVKNLGYSLSEKNSKLSVQEINKYLKSYKFRVEVYDTVDSTNNVCKKRAEDGEPEGLVIVSNEQTKGRGRQGKAFYSPSDCGIYMTILIRPKKRVEDALYITAATAVAVSDAIDSVAGVNTKIKWVNDVYYNNKKVCGILTEAAFDMENGNFNYIVVGIGINVFSPASSYPEDIKGVATSVLDDVNNNENLRNILAAKVLDNFEEIYMNFEKKEYLSKYRKKSLLTGKTVSYIKDNTEYTAKVIDIDDEFRLLVENKPYNERAVLSSGEVKIIL